jgi:hypothetical protein
LLGFFFPSTRDAKQQPSILFSTEVIQCSLDFLLHWFSVIVSPTEQQEASCSNPLSFSQSGKSDNTLVRSASSEQQLVATCHLSYIYSYRRTLNNSHSHPFPQNQQAAVCYLSLFILLV